MRLSQKGQSLIEFALIVPIFLLLVMGTFDIGRLFYIKIAMSSAAREGAYYLSYHPTDVSGGYSGTYLAIQNEADNLGVEIIPVDDAVITGCCTSGSTVEVTLTQTVNLLVFNFIRGPVQLTSTVRMMVQ